jgi:aspartate aminotransferase/aminotransferase
MAQDWIADRMRFIEASGIRKVFELARSIPDPINLSIGQPDFDVPGAIKEAAHQAIDQGHNAYTLTQGIPQLRQRLLADVRRDYPHPDRELLVTSGTTGALVLALLCTVDPGDEVVLSDPYFVMYPQLVRVAGGVPVFVDAYPDFALDVDAVRKSLSPRTKVIIVNSPANPTGHVASESEVRDLAALAAERNILLISDEIYRFYCYDRPFVSAARFNDRVLVIDGFSKSHAMTGWRLGYAHGPGRLIEEMTKLQQSTYVCAPSMVQYAGLAALDHDMTATVRAYRAKRDRIVQGLSDLYEVPTPAGAFYAFLQAPGPSAMAFVEEAIRHGLLIIPGGVFSRRDTHFRISYAASDRNLDRGVEVLRRLARPIG